MTARISRIGSVATGVLALLLFVVSVRSYWAEDRLTYSFGEHELAVDALKGSALMSWRTDPLQATSGFQWHASTPMEAYSLGEEFEEVVCGIAAEVVRPAYRDRTVVVRRALFRLDSQAFLLSDLACLPWVIRRLRLAGGRCMTCGYILGGASARCPECGEVPTGPRV